MNDTDSHKPIISTMINTVAVTFTGSAAALVAVSGVTWDSIFKATFLVLVGGGLEFFKYFGMKKKLW